MSRKQFGQLLQKYLRGECTPEEKSFVEHWYGLLETESEEARQELDSTELEDRLWQQIQDKKGPLEPIEPPGVTRLWPSRYSWIGIAASILLIAGWFLNQRSIRTYLPDNLQPTHQEAGWIEQTNTSTQPLLVKLEDGSTIQLAVQSSIRFPKHFAPEQRTVYLTGDGFFSVQKMPSRPFYVHTGNVVTKVLGTSFFIRTQTATKQVRVEVVTGRVAVYEQTERRKTTNGVVLTPNQTATFFGKEQHFVTGLVEKPRVIEAPRAEKGSISFRFNDAPLSEVLKQLEQAYGIAIEVASENQKNCPLTADLTNQPLYTQLDIICAALKSSYEVQGTTILLTGEGCTE